MSGKVKAMPEVNRQPARWTGDVPVFVTSRNTSRSTFDARRYMISPLTTGRVAYVGIACQQMSGFQLSKSCSATNAVHTRGGAKRLSDEGANDMAVSTAPVVHSREPRCRKSIRCRRIFE
jgi:hypothetical protein